MVVINHLAITAREVIYDGSPLILWRNLALICSAPYLLITFLGLGDLFGSRIRSEQTSYLESWLTMAFAGASLLTVIGTLLGFLELLRSELLIAFNALVNIAFFYRNPHFLRTLFHWFTAKNLRDQTLKFRAVLILSRLALPLLAVILMTSQVWKLNPDVRQIYLPFFEEIKLHHSLLMDPMIRDGFGFITARGHGVLLFFTGLTCADGLAAVAYIYALLIGLIVQQMTVRLLEGFESVALPTSYTKPLIASFCSLFAFWVAATADRYWVVNVGRTHLETGAFMMFFFWSAFLACFIQTTARPRVLIRMLLLPAIALPLMLPGAAFMIALPVLLLFFICLKTKDFSSARSLMIIAFTTVVCTLGSLLLNQYYLGIAEVNPYQLFLPFANAAKLAKWTSVEFLYYVNNAQGITYGPKGNLAEFVSLFARLPERFWNLVFEIPNLSFKAHLTFSIFAIWLCLVTRVRLKKNSPSSSVAWDLTMAYVGISALLAVYTSHGSLIRLLGFQVAFGAVLFTFPILYLSLIPEVRVDRRFNWLVLMGIAFFGALTLDQHILFTGLMVIAFFVLIFKSDLVKNKKLNLRFSVDPSFRFWVTLSVLFFLTFMNTKVSTNGNQFGGAYEEVRRSNYPDWEKNQTISSSFRVFSGQVGLAELAPWLKVMRCERFEEIVPGLQPILPLNGIVTIAPLCYGSSLISRTKIIETLHPPFASVFGQVMLGSPDQAIAALKGVNVNFFLVDKSEIHFWSAGVADLFSGTNLMRYFDTYYEDPDLIIFTWKGQGLRSVTLLEAKKMDLWRKTFLSWGYGPEHLRDWDLQRKSALGKESTR